MKIDNILMAFQGLQYLYFPLYILHSNRKDHLPENRKLRRIQMPIEEHVGIT